VAASSSSCDSKSEADIDRPVPAHSATGRLVGQHAVSVVLNIRNIIKRAEQPHQNKEWSLAV